MLFKKNIVSAADTAALAEFQAISDTHMMVRMSFDGTMIDANETFCRIIGVEPTDIAGNPYFTFVREKDKDGVKALLSKVAGGAATNAIVPRLNTSRDEVWIDMTYTAVPGKNDLPSHIVGIGREISDFHLRRRDNRSQVDAVARSLAVIEFDLDGNILNANDLFLESTGYTLDEIKGKHHRIFMPEGEADTAEYAEMWKRLSKGASEKGQKKRIGKSGHVIWLESTYETLVDPEGRPFKVVKYAFDITAAKDMETDSQNQIDAIQRVQAVIEFGPDGTIRRANEIFCSAMGYDESEIVGQHHRIFVDPNHAQTEAYQKFWEDLRAGKTNSGQFKRFGKGGREVYIRASYNPIKNAAGEVVKIVKFAVDTTIFQITAETMEYGMDRMAGGDLTVRLDQNLGDLDSIRIKFNSAVAKMEDVLTSVIGKSSEINEETKSITAATNELAGRTEQQASTLQESAAALEELSASVKNSAETALGARGQAKSAKDQTEQSAQVVSEAVEAMDAIADSSRQISSITDVIDDIAFQTNLLALNAGVEAARAGDAGRGFAVVASEVRALAQRSSEAAKEIAELITSSTKQVDRGVKLVGDTGTTLHKIADAVNEIHASVEQISNSSQEQAAGLSEMNAAISQLDQATQQNAAMAEETNASVHSLTQSVAEMSSEVSFFDRGSADAAELREPTALQKTG